MNKGESNSRTLIGLFKYTRLWPGLAIYCYVNILARCRSILSSRIKASVWQRDDTSRRALSTSS